MSQPRNSRVYRCRGCGGAYTSLMRLQHHRAAEHAPRTAADIPWTSRHIAQMRELPQFRRISPRGQP